MFISQQKNVHKGRFFYCGGLGRNVHIALWATVAKRNLIHHLQWFATWHKAHATCKPLRVCEPAPVLHTKISQQKNVHKGRFFYCGGLGRNRTGIEGFAVLCITTLPPGLNSRIILRKKKLYFKIKIVYNKRNITRENFL